MPSAPIVLGAIGLIGWGFYRLFGGGGAPKPEPGPGPGPGPGPSPKPESGPGPGPGPMVCLTSDVVASGETVLGVQRALAKLGYTVATDGDCGPQTKGAISLFQKDNAITVTGVANATTITAIKSVLKGLDVESGDEDPVAWTNGCNAGSQDALLTIDSIVWKGSAYPAIHKNFQESASDTWHDGYRSCFMATLKKSGAEVDEDGNVSIPLGATPPTGSIIGEVLDESGAEDEEYTEEEVAEAEAEAPDYYW